MSPHDWASLAARRRHGTRGQQRAMRMTITPSPYWTGTTHGTRYVCALCANAYLKANELRDHIRSAHRPEPSP